MGIFFEEIKQDLPNFPDEVIKDWLLPYAIKIGWPSVNERWEGIFHGKTLEFWKNTRWEKQFLDLTALSFSELTIDGIKGMKDASVFGVDNIYKREMGVQRQQRALQYILCYGKFPGVISLLYENGQYCIVDGSNRFVAWLISKDAIAAISEAEKDDSKELKEKIVHIRQNMEKNFGVTSIAPFSPVQEVWVATPVAVVGS